MNLLQTEASNYTLAKTVQRHTLSRTAYVPQGSVLAPMLFNIYMYDIPKTASTKYMYADYIALMESGLNYAEIQQTLTNDLTNLDMYLQRWRL